MPICLAVDMQGTENLARVAADVGVKRIRSPSATSAPAGHRASRSSRPKGIAEEHIRRSGVPHTIFRTSVVFGPEDHFTTNLARLLQMAPAVLPAAGQHAGGPAALVGGGPGHRAAVVA